MARCKPLNMKINLVLLILLLFVAFACSDEKDELPEGEKEAIGTVWLSGGLAFCAEQIRLDEGDTLITTDWETIYQFKGGDRVSVIYRELDNRASGCNIGVDCEIIDIEKIE